MTRDTTSPGFVVTVVSVNPEARIGGTIDSRTLGKVLDRMTDVTERVISFTYEDDEKKHDVLKLVVDNHDHYFFDHPAWIKGNLVRFFFGYPGRIFGPKYHVVDSVRGFLQLTITCVEEAALTNETDVKTWENSSIEDILKSFVKDKVFGTQIISYEVFNDPRFTEKRDYTQAKQTPWQFLQRLAEPLGAEVYTDATSVRFRRRKLDVTPKRNYEYWFGEGNLLDFDIKEWRATDRPAETVVKGYDPVEHESHDETGSNTETTRAGVLGNQNVLARTETGTLQKRLAGKTVHTTPATKQGDVKDEADTRFRKQEQKELEGTAVIIGDPELPAKSLIHIAGISRQLSGLYYIKKHTHKIDRSSGYTGSLSLLRDAVTALPSSTPPTLDQGLATQNTKKTPGNTKKVLRADKVGILHMEDQ